MAVRRFWTLAEIIAKIRRDLDLEEESFVRPQEMQDYINEAIDEAEAEIHTLYQDYFFTRAQITLVPGQENYDLPENIYGYKVRKVVYKNQNTIYTVQRIRPWKLAEKYELANNFEQNDLYQYFIENSVPGNPQMVFAPTPIDSGPFITVWYLRQANRLEQNDDVCDIPEFINFIFQYVKARIYEKEGHPNAAQARGDLEAQRLLMQGTLQEAQPDAENEIEMDMTFYEEFN